MTKSNTSYKLQVTMSDVRLTNSNSRIFIKNTEVTKLNPRVTSSYQLVLGSNSQVKRLRAASGWLKAGADAIKLLVK